MFAEGLLGASFFCSRDFPDRRDLHFIFPTLAFQLAYRYPKFRAQLVQVLTTNPDVGHESLSNQLNKLLVEPLQSTGLKTVIIIDALDECDDEEPASAILSLLSRAIDRIPSVKFFITGRPEPQIRSGFRLLTLRPLAEVLLLHEVEPTNVDEDIKTFLAYRLKELVINRSDIDITAPWPAQEDIRIITSKAGGLFIYASTVIKFVASASHTPQERLQMIISMSGSRLYEGQLGIDPLYTCVFQKSCAHVHPNDFNYFSRLLLVISSVVLLCEPISIANLATLLGLGSKAILTSIRSFHSVLLVPESNSRPIRVFHKSFPDYITDHERCKDSRFYVDSPVHHARLAIRCFELMKTGLKNNICNLPQYAMNDNVEDLSIRRQESIEEVIVYACRFWARHVCSMSQTGDNIAQVLGLLEKFIQHQLLQWLEILSVVKDLRGAVHSFIDVEHWLLKVRTSDDGLLNSIRECRRFILYSFDPIGQSAAHIYDSALLWPPASSLVRTLYQGQLRTQVKLLNGMDNSWDACIRSIQLGGATPVWSVAFSHTSDLIAGCHRTAVKILEVATGVCLATLDGHDRNVNTVAFSPDDKFLASGSDDHIVKVWDAQTGASFRTLKGHTGYVMSVIFSPTGTMIASGSSDATVRIWNLSSGDCNLTLDAHSNSVRTVCWLGTERVVSGCKDGTVKVWNVSNKECLRTFDKHSNTVWSVASSPDSSKVASGSEDKTIQVYDTATGEILQKIVAEAPVVSVCFSPDGDNIVYATSTLVIAWDLVKEIPKFKLHLGSRSVAWSQDGSCIAAGSWNGFVKIFHIDTGNEESGVGNRHSKEVLCVAFSTDGRMVASGSKDKTVKVWDATTGLVLHTFCGHSSWIRSVAFSPDSSLISSGSYDRTVRIWNLHTAGMVTTLSRHDSCVLGVRFSPDGARMVSVSEHREVTLWDVKTWEKLAHLPTPSGKKCDPRVSFSVDGTHVILEVRNVVKKWNIRTKPSSEAKSLRMVLAPVLDKIPVVPHDDVRPYHYSTESGWITDQQGRHLCWIPADQRRCSDFHGKKVILGTTSGRVVIVDLSDISIS